MTPSPASDPGATDLLSRPALRAGFERWRLVLAPGARRPTGPAEWAGCLVLVERGSVRVECEAGGGRSFAAGAMLALGWLPLRALRNPGPGEAWLLAVRRRGRPEDHVAPRQD